MKVLFFTQAYNAEATLPRTIDSVLGQTFPDLEYYVLDNGSTDRTWEIIRDRSEQDKRLTPLHLEKNDASNGGAFLTTLSIASDGDYIVWIDADDSHSPDFLEKMIPFAREHSLDIAACGYEMIDGITGELMRRKTSPENMIISGEAFVTRFIEYRAFALAMWGKLLSIPFMKRVFREGPKIGHGYELYGDANYVLSLFQEAERAGIYAEALHQYYQFPNSCSRRDLENNITGYTRHVEATRKYLESYGPVSKVNEDFVYAIYLSLVDECVDHILASDYTNERKLALIRRTFEEPLWAEARAREADPQFRNLAARRELVAELKTRIYALASTPQERELARAAVQELDKPIALP